MIYCSPEDIHTINAICGKFDLNSENSDDCLKKIIQKLLCTCGEASELLELDWRFSKHKDLQSIMLLNNNRDIIFHPVYSTGTVALRGDTPLECNRHHYWEIQIFSQLYGTDVMVGVGTNTVNLNQWCTRFCSFLGEDHQSWGYSFRGHVVHKKLKRLYGKPFNSEGVVGVHLDLYKGTIQFYLNRQPLGIAFKNMKRKFLYPMVCSTAAQSAIRLTCAVSEQSTLQMLCLEIVTKYPELYKKYRDIQGLTRYYDWKYFWIVPAVVEEQQEETDSNQGKPTGFSWPNKKGWSSDDSDDDSESWSLPVYSNSETETGESSKSASEAIDENRGQNNENSCCVVDDENSFNLIDDNSEDDWENEGDDEAEEKYSEGAV